MYEPLDATHAAHATRRVAHVYPRIAPRWWPDGPYGGIAAWIGGGTPSLEYNKIILQ